MTQPGEAGGRGMHGCCVWHHCCAPLGWCCDVSWCTSVIGGHNPATSLHFTSPTFGVINGKVLLHRHYRVVYSTISAMSLFFYISTISVLLLATA